MWCCWASTGSTFIAMIAWGGPASAGGAAVGRESRFSGGVSIGGGGVRRGGERGRTGLATPQEDTMHAMINQAAAADRVRDLQAKAASERVPREGRLGGAGGRGGGGCGGRLRRVLRQPLRFSAAAKV